MRPRYTFSHRGGDGRYYWYALPIAGDSRGERVSCDVAWFWSTAGVEPPPPHPHDCSCAYCYSAAAVGGR